MDAIEVISRCRRLGAVLEPRGASLKVRSATPLPTTLREALRENKDLVLLCLRLCQRGVCRNPFTQHSILSTYHPSLSTQQNLSLNTHSQKHTHRHQSRSQKLQNPLLQNLLLNLNPSQSQRLQHQHPQRLPMLIDAKLCIHS